MAKEQTTLYMRVPYPDESREDWFAISASNNSQVDDDGFLIPGFQISLPPYSAAVAVDTCIFLMGGLGSDLPPVGQRTRRRSLREVSVIDTRHPERGLLPGPPLRLSQTVMNCFCFCGRRHDVICALPRFFSSNRPPEVLNCRRHPGLENDDWRPLWPLDGDAAEVMDGGTITVDAVEYMSNGGLVSVPWNLYFKSDYTLLRYNLETNNNNLPLTIYDREFEVPLLGLDRGVCMNGAIYFYGGFENRWPRVSKQ